MYNEVDNALPLVEEIRNALANKINYEIVIVDDGSKDGTEQVLKSLSTSIPQLRIVRHLKNYGQSAGIISGVFEASFDWIVTLDGDSQNDPSDILKLINIAEQNSETTPFILVVGNRQKRQDSLVRKMSSRIANGVRKWFLKDDCPDTGCSLKLFRRNDFIRLPHFNHMHRFLPALFRRQDGVVLNVPVNHRPRLRGQSKYGMMNRLWVGIADLIAVSWLIKRSVNPQVEK
jgi:dolichol-phosphate mannosyltransferase